MSGSLEPREVAGAREGATGQPMYVICLSGARGAKACEKLRLHAVNIEGGTWGLGGSEFARCAGEEISFAGAASSDRRGFAGIARAIGYFVHPLGYALSAFIGDGLVFAGDPDTCGIGMLLARMLWNGVGKTCVRH